jgi:hypothetical protein
MNLGLKGKSVHGNSLQIFKTTDLEVHFKCTKILLIVGNFFSLFCIAKAEFDILLHVFEEVGDNYR